MLGEENDSAKILRESQEIPNIRIKLILYLHADSPQASLSVSLWFESSSSMFEHPAVHCLDLVLSPPSHVTEQSDHSAHSPNTGSIHSSSVWHVQSDACCCWMSPIGFKCRLQLIVCNCSVADSPTKRNALIVNATLSPNCVCVPSTFFEILTWTI